MVPVGSPAEGTAFDDYEQADGDQEQGSRMCPHRAKALAMTERWTIHTYGSPEIPQRVSERLLEAVTAALAAFHSLLSSRLRSPCSPAGFARFGPPSMWPRTLPLTPGNDTTQRITTAPPKGPLARGAVQ